MTSRELLRLVRIELANNGGRLHSRTFTERNRVYGHAHIEDAWRIYRTLAPIGIAGLDCGCGPGAISVQSMRLTNRTRHFAAELGKLVLTTLRTKSAASSHRIPIFR